MCGKRIRACPTSLYTHVQPELDGQDGAWASLGESVASITDMVRVPLITRDCCKISSATNSTRMPYDHNATATRDSCSHDMDPTKEPMPVSRSLYCDTQTQQGSRQGKAAGRAAGRAGQQAGQGSRQGRAGQGRAGQGRAGQGRAGQGRAGQGRAGQGRAGQQTQQQAGCAEI
jgi:hypothetical protein